MYEFTAKTRKRKFGPALEPQQTFLKTAVATLVLFTDDVIETKIKVGEPLPIQPRILLQDVYGNPVANKTVVAFSWPEPRMSGTPSDFLVADNKFAWLSGDESEPSDVNGIARFKNLQVVGSTTNNLYIFFTCDALATVFWGVELTKAEHVYDL